MKKQGAYSRHLCSIQAIFCLLLSLLSPSESRAQQIAIIADPHIQDVVGHPELLRTWESQAESTRLFNENYFAFLAALDDVAQRDIKLVIFPGDLTDNGQQLTCQAVTRILHEYEHLYGMRFFMTTGNHDPNTPVGSHWGQKDFLGEDGKPRVIYSDSCQFFLAKKPHEVLTPDTVVPSLRCLGYDELLAEWADFGFQSRNDYLHWERPENTSSFPDASYLVEPVEGLWLLAIDGSVHTRRDLPLGPYLWNGSWPGYNNVLLHKPFLVEWVGDVVRRAHEQGKHLVTFCHYPMVDFNRGATDIIAQAWGEKAFDLTRVPKTEVAQAFLKAGLRLHISGHMHLNNTGQYVSGDASLVDVQVPSIAGYMPSYKILTILNDSIYDFQTILVDAVPGFDTFFPRYGHLSPLASRPSSPYSYQQFCSDWFAQLVVRRFVKQDLPEALQRQLPLLGGTDWTGLDLITDLYRIRFADKRALADIPQERINAYGVNSSNLLPAIQGEEGNGELRTLREVFRCMLSGLPSDHFCVNVRTGDLAAPDSSR